MFNGIVEAIGVVEKLSFEDELLNLKITPNKEFNDLKIGDSVAVNGICLTITAINNKNFDVNIVPETIRKSNLKLLKIGSFVNLERSIKINDRINGHLVQGHSDGVGEIIDIIQDGRNALLLKISIPKILEKYIVKKGYIALDGMSITVIESEKNWISVTLIPHTTRSNISNQYHLGSLINIEVDILGKYIDKTLREIKHESIF